MDERLFVVGTSGWSYDHWKGQFYPPKFPKNRWLDYYAANLNSVEVNATFYSWFKDQTYTKWREQTPPSFNFVLKAPRLITHIKHLLDVDEPIETFWSSASFLGPKFDLVLLQIAPDTPYDPGRLQRTLAAFKEPAKVAVEFRSDLWLNKEIYTLLEKAGAVYCNPDSPQSVLKGTLTSSTGYIRLHGRQQWYAYDYSDDELRKIAGVAKDMVQRGAKKVYIYFNNDLQGFAPKNAMALSKMLLEYPSR